MTDQDKNKLAAKIFAAAANGEPCQWDQKLVGWVACDPFSRYHRVNVLLHPERYRVAPQPRVYYAVDYGSNDFGHMEATRDAAETRLKNAMACSATVMQRPRGIAKITVEPL